MKIYTKKGDQGETSLFGGTRVPKSSARIKAYGTVDELNSVVGMAEVTGCRNGEQNGLTKYRKIYLSSAPTLPPHPLPKPASTVLMNKQLIF